MATERRYLAGFGGFVRGELLHWTGWRGLVRVVAWTALVNAFLYRSITSDFAQTQNSCAKVPMMPSVCAQCRGSPRRQYSHAPHQ